MKSSQRSGASLVAAVLGLGSVASCSAILGLEDHEAFPGADASMNPDSESGSGGSGGSAGDAGAEAEGSAGAGGGGGSAGAGDGGGFDDAAVIATQIDQPSGIATDSTRVYFASKVTSANKGGVYTWDKGLVDAGATLFQAHNQVERVAVHMDRVYYVAEGSPYGMHSVNMAALDDTVVIGLTANASNGYLVGLALNADYAFFGRFGQLFGGKLDGSTPCQWNDDPACEIESTGGDRLAAVTLAGGMLYYATASTIWRRPADLQKSVAVEFLSGSKIVDMVGDESHLFWTDGNGNVNRVALASGDAAPPVNVLAASQKFIFHAPLVTLPVQHIAIDTTHVFWTTEDGFVRAVPKDGGEAIDIAKGQQKPNYIAVDDDGVYWTNLTDQSVAWAPRKN